MKRVISYLVGVAVFGVSSAFAASPDLAAKAAACCDLLAACCAGSAGCC